MRIYTMFESSLSDPLFSNPENCSLPLRSERQLSVSAIKTWKVNKMFSEVPNRAKINETVGLKLVYHHVILIII